MTGLLVVLEPITREGARQAAAHELSKGKYQAAKPSLVQQLVDKLVNLLSDNLDRVSNATPGGIWGLIGLGVLLVAVIVVVRLRTGPLSRSAHIGDPFADFAAALRPDEHRRLAEEHAAAGRYAEAIRERMRAIVRDLEERAILEPRLGRTADEVAYEAGSVLADAADDLHRAARTFDDVWYGGRPATAAKAADLRQIDQRVARARAESRARAPQLAVPR